MQELKVKSKKQLLNGFGFSIENDEILGVKRGVIVAQHDDHAAYFKKSFLGEK